MNEDAITKAFAALEVGRRRIANERKAAASSLANLYERLGVEDEDVTAVDTVLSDWHATLVKQADGLSALARKLDETLRELNRGQAV